MKEKAPIQYSPEEKEELQQIFLYLKSLTPEHLTKKEAELLQRELALEKREKEVEAKLKTSFDPSGSYLPDSQKSLDQLVFKEKQDIYDRLNAKKPKPPQIFYIKELDKTSWKLVLLGAWKYALDQRK